MVIMTYEAARNIYNKLFSDGGMFEFIKQMRHDVFFTSFHKETIFFLVLYRKVILLVRHSKAVKISRMDALLRLCLKTDVDSLCATCQVQCVSARESEREKVTQRQRKRVTQRERETETEKEKENDIERDREKERKRDT